MLMNLVAERLHNQKLSAPDFRKPLEVVHWFGAVQSQDFEAAKWALALRMLSATNARIEEEFNRGQILRTHLMRPTWHFVAHDDIRWLLELTAPRVNLKCGPNYRKLELDDAAFKRSRKVLENALKNGKHLTRAELRKKLNESDVAANDTIRFAHILIRAELDGVVCRQKIHRGELHQGLEENRTSRRLRSSQAIHRISGAESGSYFGEISRRK